MAEDEKERIDRELIELLNELRVALPGVQVLFAFLLILPFQQGFDRVSEFNRLVYLAALLSSAAASALIIAPSSYHRIHFRAGQKERMLRTSNKLLIAGTVLMALGIACSIFVIVDVLFGGLAAVVAAALTAGWFAWFWYGLPLARRRAAREEGWGNEDGASGPGGDTNAPNGGNDSSTGGAVRTV